ncbi:T9SS type A sorting domain-containing protein [Labilibacter sediminis]|nr:T9SS type A sorting domain-containing protein [Labilibacter sediminis]
MKKYFFLFLLLGYLTNIGAQDVPITCFWWNGGWDHYDGEAMEYLDEVIIFAIAPDPADGGLLEYSRDEVTGDVTYVKGKTLPGLTTTMVETIVADSKPHGVKLTLGINGMGRKDKYFNQMIDDSLHRNFAHEVKEFLLKYDMHGVDVDYEHPDDAYDIQNLSRLFIALRDSLHPHGLHVSGAFGVSRPGTQQFLQQHHELLDIINIMGYHNSTAQYIEYLEMLHGYGIPKNKIVGGHGFYYKDKKNSANYDFRDLVNLTTVTGEEDVIIMPKPEDPSITLTLTNNNGNTSLKNKVDYIRDNGYAGVMVWALNHDLPVSDSRSRLRYLRGITKEETGIFDKKSYQPIHVRYHHKKLIIRNTDLPSGQSAKFRVVSIDGKVIHQSTINPHGDIEHFIDLNKGFYIVSLFYSNNQSFTGKLIVE